MTTVHHLAEHCLEVGSEPATALGKLLLVPVLCGGLFDFGLDVITFRNLKSMNDDKTAA